MATDSDQAPHLQNSFGKNDPDKDRTNFLHSSPEVNFSASSTLLTFSQEPVKPSKLIQKRDRKHQELSDRS